MDDHRDIKLHELRQQVVSGEYRVDPRAIADAIVRRRWSVASAPHPAEAYSAPLPEQTRARVRPVGRTPAFTGARPLAA
jgi:hypothetical protein